MSSAENLAMVRRMLDVMTSGNTKELAQLSRRIGSTTIQACPPWKGWKAPNSSPICGALLFLT